MLFRSRLSADVLVSVKGRTLNRSEVNKLIPRGISSADSLLLAESFTKKWVKDVLVYDVALRNLGDEKEEVDKLVEEYRRSLVRYRYQERLVEEKLKTDIRESDKLNYYEENQKKFILDKGLIKGLFLKIPVDAPGLTDVKKWYKSTDVASLEKIEKYSVQNATIYEYFYDKWVDFDEFMKLAEQPEMRFVISNTTEAGIAFDPACKLTDTQIGRASCRERVFATV